MTPKKGGYKVTPPRVVELLQKAVIEKSQYAVAKETGLALSVIQGLLKGNREPSTGTLLKLADYFMVSVQYLRGDDRSFEDEQKYYEWKLKADDAEWYTASVDRLIADIKVRLSKSVLGSEREKIISIFEHNDVFVADFYSIQANKMDEVIDLLRRVKKLKLEEHAKEDTVG